MVVDQRESLLWSVYDRKHVAAWKALSVARRDFVPLGSFVRHLPHPDCHLSWAQGDNFERMQERLEFLPQNALLFRSAAGRASA